MPNKELNSFYKKLSKKNYNKNMSYRDDEIYLDCSLDDIIVPDGYEIINGQVLKDGIVSIGNINYNEPKKVDSASSILNKLSSVTEDEDYDDDYEDDEDFDLEDVEDLEDLDDTQIIDKLVSNNSRKNENLTKPEVDNIFDISEEKKKSVKRIKRMGQFIKYHLSSKKEYVTANSNSIENYISKDECKKMLEEMRSSYEQMLSDLEDENIYLRTLSNKLEAENNSLKKTKRRTNRF